MPGLEIERKFLVKDDSYKDQAVRKESLRQGFLSSVPERTVRIRLLDDKGYLTVKGLGNESGTTRFEWEKTLTAEEAESLLDLCEPGIIEKTRYYVPSGGHVVEVDEFYGDNLGLTLAEIELSHGEEDFLKPEWLGRDVTGQTKYYNASLSKNPFKTWPTK